MQASCPPAPPFCRHCELFTRTPSATSDTDSSCLQLLFHGAQKLCHALYFRCWPETVRPGTLNAHPETSVSDNTAVCTLLTLLQPTVTSHACSKQRTEGHGHVLLTGHTALPPQQCAACTCFQPNWLLTILTDDYRGFLQFLGEGRGGKPTCKLATYWLLPSQPLPLTSAVQLSQLTLHCLTAAAETASFSVP